MRALKDKERQNEIEQDEASRFTAIQYASGGYYLHFHRNMEIYGVVKGRVTVSINGEKRTLTDGQIAVVDSLENHSYDIDGEAEVFFFHLGTQYLQYLRTTYPKRRLPSWLMDAEYNQVIYKQILQVIRSKEPISELRRIGISCQLFADIIEHYGTAEKLGNVQSNDDIVIRVVQYIYDHYSERITLETLSEMFYLSPKALSKKIKNRLNVDLRVFINDVRVQRVVQLMDDPANRGVSISQLAAQCGFTSMTTFYRSYKRNYQFRDSE